MGQERSAADLSELAGLVDLAKVKPRMGEVFPLELAREAQDASEQGRAKGKILLKVANARVTVIYDA
jgi:alcohol dehydrogenase